MSKGTGGPAFPREDYQVNGAGGQEGMTLRDYFAAHAPFTLSDARAAFHEVEDKCVQPNGRELLEILVKMRAEYADMMLAERAK